MRFSSVTHWLYRLGVVIKGLDGVIELFSGIAVLAVGAKALLSIIARMAVAEVAEDPHDLVATFLLGHLGGVSPGTASFAALYLLGHGVIKVALAIGLWLEILWVFPVALVALLALIGVQVVQILATGSVLLTILTVVDAAIFILVVIEWRRIVSGVGARARPRRGRALRAR